MVSYLYVELSLSEALFIECSLQLVFEKRSKKYGFSQFTYYILSYNMGKSQ